MRTRERPDRSAASRGGGGRGMRRFAQAIPYVFGGVVLILYFVWMCIEMSNHANGGGALPVGIFGGALLGILAGAASVLSSRRRQ